MDNLNSLLKLKQARNLSVIHKFQLLGRGERRKEMKKLIIILFTLAVFLIPFSSVMADKGGTPNENADFGQNVSEIAKDGGIGNYASGGKVLANLGDLNGDGKVNGKDVTDKTKELINWIKKKVGRN